MEGAQPQASYTLILAKQDFKFSCAHFTLFSAEHAELLHGHNYQVRVRLRGPELDARGLLLAIEPLKRRIRELCARLDSRTLIPAESPLLTLGRDDSNITIRFRERVYGLPAADVVLLPWVNTSIELLAQMLWLELQPAIDATRIAVLAVEVEETAGQSCIYEAPTCER